MSHLPVLVNEVLDALSPKADATYVDATFGGGGYSRALLSAADCRVIGVDRDPDAISRGRALAQETPRFSMLEGCFGNIAELLDRIAIRQIDGLIADIGVSSFQIDEAERGFSFQNDGPLDMRMSSDGPSAADIIASYSESALARIFRQLGEEPEATSIARAILVRRAEHPIERTMDLASLVARAKRRHKPGRHPATQVFQALRMHVNRELEELLALLAAASALLADQGKLAVVSFHSLEDRIVKDFVNQHGARQLRPSRHMPDSGIQGPSTFKWLTRKPITPSDIEIARNPRARSAKLRVAIRQRSASATAASNDDRDYHPAFDDEQRAA